MKPTKFYYPDWLNEIAEMSAKHRINSCKELDKAKPEYIRPDIYNVIGSLGELIFFLYLEINGKKYKTSKLFSDIPIVGADVVVEDKYFIDIKTIGKETRFLSIGLKPHHKVGKNITHYVFIKLHGQNVCDIYRCEKKDVESWEIGKTTRKTGISEYYKYNL